VKPLLVATLQDPYHRVRAAAATAFQKAPVGTVAREVIEAHVAIGKLRRRGNKLLQLGPRARPALEIAARDEDAVARREAASNVWMRPRGVWFHNSMPR
jgi:hypothetical protein